MFDIFLFSWFILIIDLFFFLKRRLFFIFWGFNYSLFI